MIETFAPSEFQHRVLLIPEGVDAFLGGGRGGGKSVALGLLPLRHVEQYGARARVLYVRRTYAGLADFENLTRDLFGAAYPAARYNASSHIWRFPSGAILELGQLDGPQDYAKYQGRSFTLLLVDEVTQYPDFRLIDTLRSNLRGPKEIPKRTVMAGNPGGIGHMAVAKRFVFGRQAWHVFEDPVSKRPTVYAPSTMTDNPAIDHDGYRQQIAAACAHDPELLKAWTSGDWHIAAGAYFGDVIDESRVAFDPWPHLPDARLPRAEVPAHELALFDSGRFDHRPWPSWDYTLAYDHGSAAPAVCFVCAESPGATAFGRYFPRGSLVLVDEYDTASSDNLNEGLKLEVPEIASRIKAMCARWGVSPHGVADDAIFAEIGSASGSIAREFSRCGVHFARAGKGDRVGGWQLMRSLLRQAGAVDQPGLYVSRACRGWWQTVPFLARDTRRIEDIDTKGADHWADACRYALDRRADAVGTIRLRWAKG